MFSSARLLLIILKSVPISHYAGVVTRVLQAEIKNPRSSPSYHRHQWIHERAERGSLSSRFPDSAEISAGILSGPAASGTVEASPAGSMSWSHLIFLLERSELLPTAPEQVNTCVKESNETGQPHP